MADIKDQMQFAESTPQEAAEHIDKARLFGTSPTDYKENKEVYLPQVNEITRPQEATPEVARYIAQSPEHAALAMPDVEKLSQVESKLKEVSDRAKGSSSEQQLQLLQEKKQKTPKDFTEDDELQMFGLETELKETRKYKIPSSDKHEELIVNATEKAKEMSTLDKFTTAFKSGMATVNTGIAQTPALLLDVYNFPANMLRKLNGEEQIKSPEWLSKNPLVQRYEGAAKQFQEQVPELTKSISKEIRDGNYVEAGKVAGLQIAANAPQMLWMLTLGKMGAIESATTGVLATTAAQKNAQNQAQGVSPADSVPNALATGTIEASFERLGTLTAVKSFETYLARSFGKDVASQVLKNTFKTAFMAGAGEFAEEGAVSLAQDVTDYVSGVNPNAMTDIGWRSLDAGLVGLGSGASMTAPVALAGAYAKNKQAQFEAHPTQQAIKALKLDADLSTVVEVMNSTEMQKFSPSELSRATKNILKKYGFETFHVLKDDLVAWANSPEKAEAVRKLFDPSGEVAPNASIQIEAHDFFDVAKNFPELTEIVRLSPEEASAKQAMEYLEKLKGAGEKRQQVIEKLKVAPEGSPENQAIIDQALNPENPSRIYPSSDVFGEEEYLNQPTFTEAIEKNIGKAEVVKFNEAQKAARQSVVDNINDAANYEMEQVIDVSTELSMEAEFESQMQRLENHPMFKTVDRFQNQLFKIDPSTLPSDLAKKFAKNKQLKKHGIFGEGGMSLTDAAMLFGNNGKDLLKALSETPTREEVAQKRAEARQADIEKNVRSNTPVNEIGLWRAYSENTKNHLTELKFLLENEWSAMKTGIKRIALPLPRIEELTNKAHNAIAQTKVGRLNVNQFKVGERRSQRKAIDAILKNEVEKAFVQKQAAAQNSELTKETLSAIAKVNRVIRFAKKFNGSSVQQEIKEAGKSYVNAANEILDVFNLDPRKKGVSESGDFQKWVAHMIETGQGDFQLPERLLDVRESINEMTVEQVLAVGDKLKNILHMARLKNTLLKRHENLKTVARLEHLARRAEEEAKKVFDYNPDRNIEVFKDSATVMDNFMDGTNGMRNVLERPQHLIVKLDNNKVTGFFSDLLWQPLVNSETARSKMLTETVTHLKKVIDAFGKEDFENLNSERVDVPEFANIKEFNGGRVTKAQLLMMELNFGNEGNLIALERFGITRADLRRILDQHLEHKHTELAQNIWNIFNSFKPEIAALQMRTEGTEVEWVQAQPFEARGRQYPGGYFPINYKVESVKNDAKDLAGAGQLKVLETFRQRFYGKAMTNQGHLESRTGSDSVLDLTIHRMSQGLAQVVHDITMREAVADTAKILSDPKIRYQVVSVVGKEGYSNIARMVIDSAEAVENESYDKLTTPILGVMNYLGSGFQVVAIAGKLSSVLMQPVSLAFAVNKMGRASGSKYLAQTIYKMVRHFDKIHLMIDHAAEIHPSMKKFREDIEGRAYMAISKQLPSKKYKVLSKTVAIRDTVNEILFGTLGQVDLLNKTITVLMAYQQAMDGEAPGVARGDKEAAKKYARNLTEATQTSNDIRNLSPAQKQKWAKPFLYFYNDANNAYNNTIAESRHWRAEFKRTGDEVAKKNWKEASKAASKGVGGIMGFVMLMTVIKTYENWVRGKPQPWDDDEEETSMEAWAAKYAKYMLGSTLGGFADTIPLVRDTNYASGKYWEKNKKVDMPIDSVLGSFATAYAGLEAMLDADKEVSEREAKEMAKSIGILAKLPTDSAWRLFVESDPGLVGYVENTLERVSRKIDEYKERHKENADIPPELLKELEDLQQSVNPPADEASIEIPDRALEIVKHIESKGDPLAYNENSSAAGAYQFTESTWKDIMDRAPELGLTENGRLNADPEQQETAMRWFTEQNIKKLNKAGIEISVDSIYVAHFLGASRAIKVLEANGDTKLKTLLGDAAMSANGFKNSMKVKDFKVWVGQKTSEAETQIGTLQAKL